MVDGGYDCINRTDSSNVPYSFQLQSPITKTGKIESWCTYMHSAGTIGLRIYRLSGSQYLYIGGSTKVCSAGYTSHVTDIDVQLGDIVGLYIDSGEIDANNALATIKRYATYDVDVTYDTLTSAWENFNTAYILSIGVSVTIVSDYYVKTTGNDALDGTSWANAWKTINKAATTILDGRTLHIGFGDYILEPAANKIAPQNIGTTGIFYLPETAGTGGGTGTVSIEQNA